MSGKRILILYNRVPYPLNDGGNIAVNAMLKGYRRQGWQVYLLAMNTSRHRVTDAAIGNIYTDIYKFEALNVENDVKLLNTLSNYFFSSLPNHVPRFEIPAFKARLVEVLETFRPNVVQLESVFLSSYLPVIRKCTSAKIALRMHNVEGQVWRRLARETVNPVKKMYLTSLAKRIRNYESKVWNQFDLLIPITGTDAESVKKAAIGIDVITIPVGIDADTDKKAKEQIHEKWIGYHIGAMDWLPNQEAIVWFIKDIWPEIHKKLPDFTFQFAGRNMPANISQLHTEGVLCVGEVSDASAFIADKKILIVPLRSGGGIRVKILEAMHMGKLVISTAVGMQGIEAKEGVHYLLANDAGSFTNAIDWALQNREEAEKIGGNASMLVKKAYNLEALSRLLSEYLTTRVVNK